MHICRKQKELSLKNADIFPAFKSAALFLMTLKLVLSCGSVLWSKSCLFPLQNKMILIPLTLRLNTARVPWASISSFLLFLAYKTLITLNSNCPVFMFPMDELESDLMEEFVMDPWPGGIKNRNENIWFRNQTYGCASKPCLEVKCVHDVAGLRSYLHQCEQCRCQ